MNKKKKIVTSLVAIICVCALTLQAVGTVPFYSMAKEKSTQETTYTEYTFSDVGIEDGAYTYGNVKTWGISKLDKIAFTGTVQFSSDDAQPGIGFIRNAGDWNGIKFIIAMEGLYVQDFITHKDFKISYQDLGFASASQLTDKAMKLRVTFDEKEKDLTMTVTVNDSYTTSQVYDATQFTDIKSILVYGTNTAPITVASQSKDDTSKEPEYTEYTFSDVGIEDGAYTYGNVKTWGISKLDKIAFTGTVQFSSDDAQPGIGFIRNAGDWNGIKFIIAMEGLYVQDFITHKDFKISYQDLGFASASQLTDKAMKLRVTFDEKEKDLTMTVTVNDSYTTSQVYDATQFTDIKSILIYGTKTAPITVQSESKDDTPSKPVEPEEPSVPDTPTIPEGTYKEYTFYNFGFVDGQYDEAKAVDWEISDYDKIAFTGEIKFPQSELNAGIVLAPSKGNWSGLNIGILGESIYLQDYLGKKDTSVSFTDLGYKNADEFYADYVKIRMLFNVDGDNIKLTLVFNDVAVKEMTYTKAQLSVVTAFVLRTALDKPVQIKSVYEGDNKKPEDPTKPQVPEGPYQEYTFYNLGLANGTYQDVKCVDWKVNNYDKVAFSGKIAFPKSNLDAGIVFAPSAGDWNGLNIGVHEETLYIQNYLTHEDVFFKITDLGYKSVEDFYGKFVDIRLLFNNHDSKVRMTVVINETAITNVDFTKAQLQSLGVFVVRAAEDKPLTIQSVYVGDNKAPEQQPEVTAPVILTKPTKSLSSYTEVTFSTLRIEDQTVKTEAKSGMLPTLDGRVFKSKITFPGEGKGSLTVGGNTDNMWFGIHVESVNGGLVLYEAANGAQKWSISKEQIGKDITKKEIALYLTFHCVDERNVYIGVYVDGKFCGERLYADLQEAFGGGILIYSAEAGIKIRSVATAWERFLMSRVNLAYFGFTNNWKAELLQRSR